MSQAPTPAPSPFQYCDFTLLCLARVAGTLGIQMMGVAIGWQIYDLTHDPFSIGLVGLAQFLPSILLVLFAGQVADRFDRRRILTLTYAMLAVAMTCLAVATALGMVTPSLIYMVAVVQGVARIFGAPAQQALLPASVPAESFGKAVAYHSSMFQVATILGPASAGAVFYWGTASVYAVASILMFAVVITSLFLRIKQVQSKKPMTLENLLAGIVFIKQRPALLGSITLDLFAVLFASVVALLPIYARDILQVGPQGLGLLRSAPAIGAGLMAVWLGRFGMRSHAGKTLFASIVVFACVTMVFGVSQNTFLSFAMLVLLGCADMVSVYVRTHLMQMNTPDDMRGRVSAVNTLFITTSNELGDFESGVMASWLGTVPAVVTGGVFALVTAGFIAWHVPSLRNLKSLEGVP